jgi:UDP-N-acetylglucosamine 2-epimerase
MLKVCTIVGARPQFIKADPLSRALTAQGHSEILIHTGQHYDHNMSEIFFQELGIRSPSYSLGVGSGAHGAQTAQMLVKIEEALLREQPDVVVVYGDTNSTLAGALAAAKLHIPVAHVEAGERSFDRRMPEEINRIVADSLASLHFCASRTAVAHLAAEGIASSAYWVGDVMLDVLCRSLPIARRASQVLDRLELRPQGYALVTIHRVANTDDPAALTQIVAILNVVDEPVIFPAHPRTRAALSRVGAELGSHVRLIEPVGYFDMLQLEEHARIIATDSGGVQREAYFLGVPCLVLRETTEWAEAVEAGWNRLVGVDPRQVLAAWASFAPPAERPPLFGDGNAGAQIVDILGREIAGQPVKERVIG